MSAAIYTCEKCQETFVGQGYYSKHMDWHKELDIKRAKKKKS